ncbi:MAG TPA: hypothetical protein VMU40_20325 [Steroidobacteraceae bacterium]|nr:hypothetical protein [Steroidobacteraceae bacterium]
MSPPRSYRPSRPQSIGEVLDSGFRIFQSTLLPCLPYGALWVILGQLANLHDLAAGRPLRILGGADSTWWLWYVSGALLSILIWGSLILRQSALLSGAASSMGAELLAVLARAPQLLVLLCVGTAVCMVGLALLVVPGLYLLIAFAFAMPAMLTCGLGPLDALKYCARLLYGHWWRTTFILAVAAIVVLALYAVLATATLLAFGASGIADVALVTAVSRAVGVALGALLAPFACAMILATFGELRARREAADLHARIARAES